ncbi:hypothetical protein FXB39_07825 [Nocardioides sp. BGMRC 2183]|nr:hypothetical protein FXB39_07825 [Nocardioides sp. BGMRC 2183]
MIPDSPAQALDRHASGLRELVVRVVRDRHERFAEAHQVSESRYAMGFGSQWRDLLDDTHEAVTRFGFASFKLLPAGYKLPVVNDCLIYVWRIPDNPDAVSDFASSPTRRNGFVAAPPDATLFEPSFADQSEPDEDPVDEGEIERVVRSLGGAMPVVLVMVESTPRLLQSIQWAVAVLDEEGNLVLRGHECIWDTELSGGSELSSVESFDSGAPAVPVVELQEQERPVPDA